jgi:hypothetical protein
MSNTISSIGLEGMQRGMASAYRHSQEVFRAFSSESEDPTGPIVALKQDQFAVEASAKVIKVDRALDKAVLDIIA